MPLTEDIMHTQLDDKVDEYNALYYKNNSYKQEKFEETINDIYIYIYDIIRFWNDYVRRKTYALSLLDV